MCSLLRAGADPHPEPAVSACRSALVNSLPIQGAVWLLCCVVRMRYAAFVAGGGLAAECEDEDGLRRELSNRESESDESETHDPHAIQVLISRRTLACM